MGFLIDTLGDANQKLWCAIGCPRRILYAKLTSEMLIWSAQSIRDQKDTPTGPVVSFKLLDDVGLILRHVCLSYAHSPSFFTHGYYSFMLSSLSPYQSPLSSERLSFCSRGKSL